MAGQSLLPERGATSAPESPRWQFLSLPSDSPAAAPIKRYIQDQFARCHGASVQEFLPLQLAMLHDDRIKAAAGIRVAEGVPLFIEQYLDQPCDKELARYFHVAPPARHTIGEVGNLAATESGAVRELFVHIAAVAHACSLEWLTCNATQRVQAILRYMRLPFFAICAADPARITDVERWGTYYDQPSHVMAAPLGGVIDVMARSSPSQLARAEGRVRATTSQPISHSKQENGNDARRFHSQ